MPLQLHIVPAMCAGFLMLLGVGNAAADSLLPAEGEADFRYASEYPAIPYSTLRPTDRIARLQARLDAGEARLGFDPEQGWMPSLLEALEIDPASQVLVFSKTSLNKGGISPRTPRAIYFNDDTYVARVPGAGMLEIATMDPALGPLFYVLEEAPAPRPSFDRQTVQCLRCHDSLTLTGGGVPRFILGSGYIDTRGNLVSHEGWILTDQTTPLKFRWGGWYVTGSHGAQEHLGNIIVRDPATLYELDKLRVYDLPSVEGLVESQLYPVATSDIVALLVLEHQVHVQNLLTRVNYDVRTALADESPKEGGDSRTVSDEMKSLIEQVAEPLVQAMLFAGEPELKSPVEASNGFPARFEQRGPFDGEGRSLRQLDLNTSVFRYPVSYLVYSAAFDGLPEAASAYVFRRIHEVLASTAPDPLVARYSREQRQAAFEVLLATRPAFARIVAAAPE